MSDLTDYRDDIRTCLEREDLVLDRIRDTDDYVVRGRSRRAFWYEPVLTLPAELLAEYLDKMSEQYGMPEALSLTKIHAVEYLTTDHGEGLNATTALGFRRTKSGEVEFFLDQDPPA
ncbi:hypothetical protein SAMN05192558_111110 [Actinokineospora alba]|uniref:Uncharacterized protein n=1 Tax=Actinokineospora alba TaxID=504798 RepID=A0A1H0UDQ8_9PSEU|nr:hypothetical protein C8E96_0649 [Actinokineospora alba]SDH55761.1 hypothetical protein SAMN05421871_101471 [Actinokineospora alba]SDP64319.1 hypothetical protein SAMN05192558_111110 [Actinokineospora alba]